MKFVVAPLFLILALFSSKLYAEEESVAAAIEKALPYLEREGIWWIEKKECVSCHHTTFLVWAKDLALEAGFPVDPAPLADQRSWMIEEFFSEIEGKQAEAEAQAEGERKGDRNVEGVSQFLVSPSSLQVSAEIREALRKLVASNQEENGSWKPDGQLPMQARPKLETTWISNQWADLALRDSAQAPPDQIITWKTGTPATTTEWYAMNLLGYPNEKSMEQLLRRQNEDGGWSWKSEEGSDPTATGQALFALGRSDLADRYPEEVERARRYLVGTQRETGSWKTMSTKDRSESTRVSDFWGSAWAVIGLLESN